MQNLIDCDQKNVKHKPRDNALGVTWCVRCGRLFNKPCGKPLQEVEKLVIRCTNLTHGWYICLRINLRS
jgi:hypothetical protein